MKNDILDIKADVSEAASRVKTEVERVKEVMSEAVEDGFNATRRAVKKGRRAAEDLIDDAEYQVKQHPFGSVGVSFGVGLGLGALIGILLARSLNSGK